MNPEIHPKISSIIPAFPPAGGIEMVRTHAVADFDHDESDNGGGYENEFLFSGDSSTVRPEAEDEFGLDSPTGIYLRDIARVPLLTAEEEVTLAKARENGLEAAKNLREDNEQRQTQVGRGGGKIYDEETAAKIQEWEEAVRVGEAATRRLVESNLRLVVSVARKYTNRGLSLLDLIQEGNIGLQRGVEKYDWRRGFRFSTYTYWWIRQAVSRAVAEQARTIRLPVHIFEQLGRVNTTARELQVELGREPTPDEIGKEMGIEGERIKELFRVTEHPLSLETVVGERQDATLEEIVADEDIRIDPQVVTEQSILEDDMDNFISTHLSPREAQVLRLRFGLGEGVPRTLAEVGQALGVSRERARQLEEDAMRKLRRARADLVEYLD